MSKQTTTTSKSPSRLIVTAVSTAILLALLCIGVSIYVVWYLHNMDFFANSQEPAVSSSLNQDLIILDQRMVGLDTSVRQQLRTLEEHVDGQLVSLESTTETRLQELETTVDGRIASLGTTIDQQFNSLSTEFSERLRSLEQTLTDLQTQSDQDFRLTLEPLRIDLEQLRISSQEYLANPLSVVTTNYNITEPQIIERFGETSLIIQRGDSIWSIARRFQDPPSLEFIERIAAFNQIADPRRLRIGSVIVIPELTKPVN